MSDMVKYRAAIWSFLNLTVQYYAQPMDCMKAMGFWLLWSLSLWFQWMEFEAKARKSSKNGKKWQKFYIHYIDIIWGQKQPNSQTLAKMVKNRKDARFRHKIGKMAKNCRKWPKIIKYGQNNYLYESDGFPNPLIIVSVIPIDAIWGKSSTWEIKFICCNFDFKLEFCCITWFRVFFRDAICCILPTPKK